MIRADDAGLKLDDLDIEREMGVQLTRTKNDYTRLSPDEVEDIFLVIHYSLLK
jgi:hypothetical protein